MDMGPLNISSLPVGTTSSFVSRGRWGDNGGREIFSSSWFSKLLLPGSYGSWFLQHGHLQWLASAQPTLTMNHSSVNGSFNTRLLECTGAASSTQWSAAFLALPQLALEWIAGHSTSLWMAPQCRRGRISSKTHEHSISVTLPLSSEPKLCLLQRSLHLSLDGEGIFHLSPTCNDWPLYLISEFFWVLFTS